MKKILIFGSGEEERESFYSPFLDNSDNLIIAVDGGANLLFKLRKKPDILIGDNDSIDEETLKKLKETSTNIFIYPNEKNYSDFELASDYIIKNEQRTNIILFNMFGKRVDQFLFNLEICKKLTNAGFCVSMLGSRNEIHFLKDGESLTINGKKGNIVSILPTKESIDIKRTDGLKYELNNEKLYTETTRGLSNELISDSCTIEINKGMAIVLFLRNE